MRKLFLFLMTMLLLAPVAAAEHSTQYIAGENADRVHLRSGPSRSAESLGLYYTGTAVESFQQNGDWTYVVIGASQGWIMTDYLSGDAPAQLGPWMTVDHSHSTWVNLRAASAMNGAVLQRLDNGTVVHVLGETADGWSYVECRGVKGYIVSEYLEAMGAEAFSCTTILGLTADWDYIHQYIAPNGQALYFTAVAETPFITFRDVNFDGATDIVAFVCIGASNFYTEFFVYDTAAQAYSRAEHRGIDYGLSNYQLYPEYGIVESSATNGYAGALHEICLFRWEGTELKLIRRAVSAELTETTFDTDSYTTTTHANILHVMVADYQSGEYRGGEGTIIWDQTATLDEYYDRDIYDEEQEALWQGLR